MSLDSDGWLKARILSRVEQLSLKSRGGYLFVTFLLALVGYGFFVLLPLIIFGSIAFIAHLIPTVAKTMDWIEIGVASLFALVCILTLIRLFQFKFLQVQGLKVSREQAPCLYDAITEVREHYKRPTIKGVVITDRPELRIENVPHYGFPILSFNYIVVGLPLLQTLSMEEFRCELARVIGQYSGMSHRLTFFIFKTDRLWNLYNRSLKKNGLFGLFLLRWFYKLYAPLFHIIARPAIRLEEMEADLCALDYINEREVFDAMKSRTISDIFLERCYWPNVKKMVLKNTEITVRPFENLEKIACTSLNKEGRKKWLENAYRQEQLPEDVMPSFRQRMEHMGHSKIKSIPAPTASALEEVLGDGRKNVIALIEKLWSSTFRLQWVKDYKEMCQLLETIKKLSQKSRNGVLWPAEILSYALLDKKLRGNPIKASLLKILKRNFTNMLPAFIKNRERSAEQANDIF